MSAGRAIVADERYLTVEDIAERLQVSPWAVRDWIKSGRLVGFQPGGRRVGWRVRESDLERFVEQAIAQQGSEGEEPS
jgi:excisionase family DNA binding protein